MIKTIVPDSKEHWLSLRVGVITSTEVAALFNCSPYSTSFEIWHRKKNSEVVEIEPNTRMTWGTRLQDSIAAGVAEDNGWTVRRMDEFMFDDKLRMGASFDFSIEGDGQGILEIKNVDSLIFKDGWLVDGDNLEAPPQIELQVQMQLMISGRAFAYIAALVGGNSIKLIRREPDLAIHEAIKLKVAEFWDSIDVNEPPAPDFSRDLETIKRLYSYACPGKVMDARGDDKIANLINLYKHAGDAEKIAKANKDSYKAELLTLVGDSEKVIGEGWSIAAGVIGPTEVPAHTRSGYRNWKVYHKRGQQ